MSITRSRPTDDLPAPPELTKGERRKLGLWRRLLIGCLVGAGIALAAEIVLLAIPGVRRGLRMTVGGIFVELAISSAVLGALGRCPACNSGFDASPQRLFPERCPACRALLVTR